MCDRVLIIYRGSVVRTLEGASINEHNIVAASLNLDLSEVTPFEEDQHHG